MTMNDSLIDQMFESALGISKPNEQQTVQQTEQQTVQQTEQQTVQQTEQQTVQQTVQQTEQQTEQQTVVNKEPIKGEDVKEKSVEKLKDKKGEVSFLERNFPKEENFKTLEEENKRLKEDYNKLRNSMLGFEEGINPDYLRLHKIEKDNPKLASVYKRLLLGNLTSKEYIMMSMVMNDPDLAEDKEMLNMLLEEKYPGLFDEYSEPESKEYKKSMKLFEYDAKKAEQMLRQEFEKIEVPKFKDNDVKDKTNKVFETWRDFDFSNKDLTTVNVSLSGDKEGETVPFMDIEIPEKERDRYLKAALVYMIERGIENGKDSGDMLKKLVTGMWIGENLNTYNRLVIEQRMRMSDREWRKFIHNPKEQKTNISTSEKDLIETMFDEIG